MKLVCAKCNKVYLLKDNAIPDGGKVVRCKNCDYSWFQKPDSPSNKDDNSTFGASGSSKIPTDKNNQQENTKESQPTLKTGTQNTANNSKSDPITKTDKTSDTKPSQIETALPNTPNKTTTNNSSFTQDNPVEPKENPISTQAESNTSVKPIQNTTNVLNTTTPEPSSDASVKPPLNTPNGLHTTTPGASSDASAKPLQNTPNGLDTTTPEATSSTDTESGSDNSSNGDESTAQAEENLNSEKIPNFKPKIPPIRAHADTVPVKEEHHTLHSIRKSLFRALSYSTILLFLTAILFQDALPLKIQGIFRIAGLYNTRGIALNNVNVRIFNEFGGLSMKLNGSLKNNSSKTLYVPDINIKIYNQSKKPSLSVHIDNNGKILKGNESYRFDEIIHNIPLDSYIMSVHAGNILESSMN